MRSESRVCRHCHCYRLCRLLRLLLLFVVVAVVVVLVLCSLFLSPIVLVAFCRLDLFSISLSPFIHRLDPLLTRLSLTLFIFL